MFVPLWVSQVGEVIKNRQDKWYDQKFVHHSLSSLRCYPVYMQVSTLSTSHHLERMNAATVQGTQPSHVSSSVVYRSHL